MTLAERRRALMGAHEEIPVVDTSATSSAFYIRKYSAETILVYANPNGSVKVWYDNNKTTGNFGGASYSTVPAKQYDSPWEKVAERCKFGGSATSPATSVSSANLKYAHAYWKQTGRVMFAGIYSPYYGLSNIDGTRATPGWSG